MNNSDVYFKKNVIYNYRGKNLTFRVSQSLFSSHDIDLGTKHLLQTLTNEGFNNYSKALDFGCGYGPMGILLKSAYQPSIVHMVDRDALALNFSQQNVELNNLNGIKVYGSLGYDDVPERDFDLIISNIPAKVGEPVLSYILEEVKFYVRPEGRIAIVVIDAIGDYVTKVLESNKNINIIFRKRWPGHLVFHYKFFPDSFVETRPKSSAFDRGIYNRGQKSISVEGFKISIETTYGLPEFDTLSYETELLLNKMHILKNQQIKKAVLFNVGQGFIPTALSTIFKPEEVNLIDRDLQSLRISKRNIISNGYPADRVYLFHEIDFSKVNPGSANCIIGILDEKDDSKIHSMFIRQVATKLSNNGTAMFASSSTAITRIETLIRKEKFLGVFERQKSKRKSILVLRHKN